MTNTTSANANIGTVGAFTYGHDSVRYHYWDTNTKVNIGKYCSISSDVHMILGGNHLTDWASMYPFGHWYQDILGHETMEGHPASKGDINIGNDVWIGVGVTILSGVTIGNGSVIGARSVVSKDVPAYSIVVGNPGQVIKSRFSPEVIELLESIAYWNLPTAVLLKIKQDLCKPATVESLQKIQEKINTLL